MKRLFVGTAAALIAGLSLVGPASVHAYPPDGGTVTTKEVGSSVEVTVTGFKACAGTAVTIVITPPGGGAPLVFHEIADAGGKVVVVVADGTAKGKWEVVATDPPCQGVKGEFGSLPRTGSDTRSWVLPSVAIVVSGLGLLLVARRRHQQQASA